MPRNSLQWSDGMLRLSVPAFKSTRSLTALDARKQFAAASAAILLADVSKVQQPKKI
jgi:hypothetical protein